MLVTGSRHWRDGWVIDIVLQGLADWALDHGELLTIVHGACEGADELAGEWEGRPGVEVRPYPAEWDQHGRAAGPIRNREMLSRERPDVVFAFHEDLEGSRGTKDMTRRAVDAGLPVYLVTKVTV